MLDSQQDLFEKLIEELDSHDQNVIILKGNAGVGKTYVIGQLIKEFKARKDFTISLRYLNRPLNNITSGIIKKQ